CANCIPPGVENRLGVGCSDAYSANQFMQSELGPRSQINAHTGAFPAGCVTHPSGGNTGLLEVDIADLAATDGGTGAPVRYFVQYQYVAQDDAAAHNQNNNASSRELAVTGSGTSWLMGFASGSQTQTESPAIRLWKTIDSGVVETDINTPEDDAFPGLVIMAAKATDLGTGFWRYEYAVNNLNSDRSIGSLAIPCSNSATVQNVGFHGVLYRGGDGVGGVNYDSSTWPGVFSSGSVTWTVPSGPGTNANAIRWGTLYNFRFDANRPPTTGTVTLGEFKAVVNVTASSVVPSGP
ncbi:MAG TPA: hypothetical protein VMV81_00170, partial [Phycisphaerae bacterium]|nr:hypothetical protein [Phycisphaerae bacterium]